jgi:hypothetical protein
VTENFLGGQYTEQVICQDVTEYFKLWFAKNAVVLFKKKSLWIRGKPLFRGIVTQNGEM